MSNHEKKVVREQRLRQEKIKQALAKKPSSLHVRNRGLSSHQIQQQLNRQRLHGADKKTIRETLKRDTLSLYSENRPSKANRAKKENPQPGLLLGTPNVTTQLSVEYPTPNWFKYTEKADVSVIVPLFKSKEAVRNLIRSWDVKNNGLKVEMIFVDDECPQDSKDMALRLWGVRKHELEGAQVGKIYYNPSNMGFGMACNVGAENATGEYLIFLNADTLVTKGWVEPMVEVLKDPEVGLVGNLQLKKGGPWDGSIDSAGSEWTWSSMSFSHIGRHTFKHKHLATPFYPDNAPPELMQPGPREMVTGCCVGVRRELFKHIGGFNPNYRKGYWEDSDLSMTVREKGYKVMYTPHSKIYHVLGHSGSGNHRFHSHNRQFFMNKWVNSCRIDPLIASQRKTKPKVGTILLRRREAIGDVLLASAVAPALKKKYPKCEILFNTRCPEVLKNNPFIDKVVKDEEVSERSFQVYYNLDMIYEQRPHAHILEAYADAVGVDQEDCIIHLSTEPYKNVPPEYVVIHVGPTAWAGRNWDLPKFETIASRLRSEGHKVVCVGSKGNKSVPCDVDLVGKTSISELGSVIKGAKLFVGIDSFPMHVAQTFDVPGACFFGSIDPSKRLFSNNITPITAKGLECLGCHHRKPTPSVVTNICETATLDCIDMVNVEQMWETVQSQLRKGCSVG